MSQHCQTFTGDETIGDLYGYMETVKKRHNNAVHFGEFLFSVNGNGELIMHLLYEIGQGSK